MLTTNSEIACDHEQPGDGSYRPERDRDIQGMFPGKERRPRKTLKDSKDDQVEGHQADADRRQPVMPFKQPLAVPGRLQQPGNQIGHGS